MKKESKMLQKIKQSFKKIIGLRPLFKFLIFCYFFFIAILLIVIIDQTKYYLISDINYENDYRQYPFEKGEELSLDNYREKVSNDPIFLASKKGASLYFEPLTANFMIKKQGNTYNTIPYREYGYSLDVFLNKDKQGKKVKTFHEEALSPIIATVKTEVLPQDGGEKLKGYQEVVLNERFKAYKISDGLRLEYRFKTKDYNKTLLPYQISLDKYNDMMENYCYTPEEVEVFKKIYLSDVGENNHIYFIQGLEDGSRDAMVLYKIWYSNYNLDLKELEKMNEAKTIYDYDFIIPVEYRLKSDGTFNVKVLNERIENNSIFSFSKKWYLKSIALHPEFLRIEPGKKAHTFIPDGSGVLIENDPSIVPIEMEYTITKGFYDNKRLIIPDFIPNSKYRLNMPVFGYYENDIKNNKAILGIINQGARQTELFLRKIQGKTYIMTNYDYEFMGKYSFHGSLKLDFPSPRYTKDRFEISYVFMGNNEAPLTYFDFVEYLQNELSHNFNKLDKKKREIVIEILGSFEEKKHAIGIPYYTTTPLTTFSEAEKLIDIFNDCSKTFVYQGWTKGSEMSQIANTKLKYAKSLGGNNGFCHLVNYANENDKKIYLSYNLIKTEKEKVGKFRNRTHGNNYIGDYKSSLYENHIVLGEKNEKEPYYLLSPRYLSSSNNYFLDKNKYENIVINDLGSIQTFDYYAKNITPEVALEIERAELSKIEKNRNVIIRNPFFYSLFDGYDYLLDLERGSGNILEYTYEIPFTYLVYTSFFNISLPSSNIDNKKDSKYDFLYSLMTNSNMKYTLSYKNTELKNASSKYFKYYSTSYYAYLMEIKNYNKEKNEFYNIVGDNIISHEVLKKDIFLVKYDKGDVLFNLTDDNFIFQNKIISPKSYYII